MIILSINCNKCNSAKDLELPEEITKSMFNSRIEAKKNSGLSIDALFPELSKEQRIQLRTGTCMECQAQNV